MPACIHEADAERSFKFMKEDALLAPKGSSHGQGVK